MKTRLCATPLVSAGGDELQLPRIVMAPVERHVAGKYTRPKTSLPENPFGRSQTPQSKGLRQPASQQKSLWCPNSVLLVMKGRVETIRLGATAFAQVPFCAWCRVVFVRRLYSKWLHKLRR